MSLGEQKSVCFQKGLLSCYRYIYSIYIVRGELGASASVMTTIRRLTVSLDIVLPLSAQMNAGSKPDHSILQTLFGTGMKGHMKSMLWWLEGEQQDWQRSRRLLAGGSLWAHQKGFIDLGDCTTEAFTAAVNAL